MGSLGMVGMLFYSLSVLYLAAAYHLAAPRQSFYKFTQIPRWLKIISYISLALILSGMVAGMLCFGFAER